MRIDEMEAKTRRSSGMYNLAAACRQQLASKPKFLEFIVSRGYTWVGDSDAFLRARELS